MTAKQKHTNSLNTKIIKINDGSWMYIGNYNLVFKNSKLLSTVISLLNEGKTSMEIINSMDGSNKDDSVSKMIKDLEQLLNKQSKFKQENKRTFFDVTEKDWLSGELLSGIFLNVSNDCNLRCVYCYGDGGTYGYENDVMTLEMAKNNIDYWIKYLNNKSGTYIPVIFFGGEPLMNVEVIEFAAYYINEELKKRGQYPLYSLTTNGTILNDKIVKILKRYGFNVTVSIDGNKKIHDANRPHVSGRGTFDLTIRNLKELNKRGIDNQVRMTITKDTVPSMLESINDLWGLGVSSIYFDIVVADNEKENLSFDDLNILKLQLEKLLKITEENLLLGKENVVGNFIDIGSLIYNNIKVKMCSYNSRRGLLVGTKGDFFRCHRLYGDEDFIIGNRLDGLNWEKLSRNNNLDKYCENCWAGCLCNKCAHANYNFTGNLEKPGEVWCEFRKLIVELSLKLFINIQNKNAELLKDIYR